MLLHAFYEKQRKRMVFVFGIRGNYKGYILGFPLAV